MHKNCQLSCNVSYMLDNYLTYQCYLRLFTWRRSFTVRLPSKTFTNK